jgi:hypothetical protein
MNTSALIFIVVTWGTLIVATIYCFYKMLTAPPGREDEEQVPPTP